jgi:2-polyprenyl-6-methoxyphenol hydroxylase-like FAD-dependent oxidoreductase
MNRGLKTDVLVVGAGPVGLVTALLLAEAGIQVTIIDREQRAATHSYACGLHARSLKLLARLGLLDGILAHARRIDTVAFYSQQGGREAEVSLTALPVEFPFVLVVPQDRLEMLLANRLAELDCPVRWHHRLADLQPGPDVVLAEVDKLVGTATGSAVPRWHWVVGRTIEVAAQFVVGADGHHSMVRQRLWIENERLAPPEQYVVYEFKPEIELADEIRVVLADTTKSVVWPLPDGRCRWSFQIAENDETEFPEKDREPYWSESPVVAQRTWQRLQQRLAARAPWFGTGIRELDWATDIQFHPRLAQQYGRGRCWLAGDAAHQTAPAGIQSMNVGFLEAEDLAGRLAGSIQGANREDALTGYEETHRDAWRLLLGAKGAPQPGASAKPWVVNHARQMLSALPASGDELRLLLGQLGLDLP